VLVAALGGERVLVRILSGRLHVTVHKDWPSSQMGLHRPNIASLSSSRILFTRLHS
jgi:hypothetical protein